MKSTITKN
ncbi:Protein of unknown function [Lactobacillus helveticus CIRM-BIA 101]|nr:Protein of unknown function [Lactobacillus helveticus CIRM-BIA 101]